LTEIDLSLDFCGGGDGIRTRGPYVANVSEHVREPLVHKGFIAEALVPQQVVFATPSHRIDDVRHESTNGHGQTVATQAAEDFAT
jgi:hypothetical protein